MYRVKPKLVRVHNLPAIYMYIARLEAQDSEILLLLFNILLRYRECLKVPAPVL